MGVYHLHIYHNFLGKTNDDRVVIDKWGKKI
jgi:hypothetical protein